MKDWFARLFTKASAVTILRYGLVALGGYLTGEGRLDAGQWETISGAILVIAGALFGSSESAVEKVVVDGRSVAASKLTPTLRNTIRNAADDEPQRGFFSQLFGK